MNILDTLTKAIVGNAPTSPENAARPSRDQVITEGPHSRPATGYRGATQSGTLDSPELRPSRSQLSPEAKAELRITQLPPPAPRLLDGVPFPTPDQQRAFDSYLRDRGYQTPEDVAAKLAELDAPWLRLQQAITVVAGSQSASYSAHVASIASRVAAGDTTVEKEDAWTAEDWSQDARVRLSAFKAECKKTEAQAWEIAEPALKAKADFADTVSDDLDAEAVKPFQLFAVPYRPPAYVMLLRKYAEMLRSGSRRTVGKPSAMIETL